MKVNPADQKNNAEQLKKIQKNGDQAKEEKQNGEIKPKCNKKQKGRRINSENNALNKP